MTSEIIDYMSSLTSYYFDRLVLERIAVERGVQDVKDITELTKKQKDLVFADMLLVLYLSPTQTASLSKKHGSFSQTIGSQYISDKAGLLDLITKLYAKWGDDKLEDLGDMGNLEWIPM